MHAVHTVDIEQLAGRYRRLSQELAVAYGSVPWNTGHIDRLTHDLVATEREIGAATVPNTSEIPADAGSDGRLVSNHRRHHAAIQAPLTDHWKQPAHWEI